MFTRSVVPDENSHPILSAGTSLVTDATPLKDRWGGWYVSGTLGDPHLGNRWIPGNPLDGVSMVPQVSRYRDLGGLIDTGKYLEPTSDVVALLVLEHQCRVHNLITKAQMSYRRALSFQESSGDLTKLEAPEGMAWKPAESAAKDLVAAFLLTDEADLGGEGGEGSSRFVETLKKRGVTTQKVKGT